jgi:hypothetical protein
MHILTSFHILSTNFQHPFAIVEIITREMGNNVNNPTKGIYKVGILFKNNCHTPHIQSREWLKESFQGNIQEIIRDYILVIIHM